MARRTHFFHKTFAFVMITLVATPTLMAAETSANQDFISLQALLEAGGWTLKLIILLSIIALGLTIFFLLTFRAGMIFPRPFMNEAMRAAEEGDREALQSICTTDPSPAARIIAAATEQAAVTDNADYMAIRDAVEDEGARQASGLWQRLQYLMDVAVIAPMVGLLGTVLGMLTAFADLRTEIGGVRPDTLSQGVAKALITTAGGLIVGILAMILYAIFRGRVNGLIAGLEESCSRVLRVFITNYSKQDGK
jgi:biopolymer transport protein ExbB